MRFPKATHTHVRGPNAGKMTYLAVRLNHTLTCPGLTLSDFNPHGFCKLKIPALIRLDFLLQRDEKGKKCN